MGQENESNEKDRDSTSSSWWNPQPLDLRPTSTNSGWSGRGENIDDDGVSTIREQWLATRAVSTSSVTAKENAEPAQTLIPQTSVPEQTAADEELSFSSTDDENQGAASTLDGEEAEPAPVDVENADELKPESVNDPDGAEVESVKDKTVPEPLAESSPEDPDTASLKNKDGEGQPNGEKGSDASAAKLSGWRRRSKHSGTDKS